jgi:predicted TPR repeat methyltransferase
VSITLQQAIRAHQLGHLAAAEPLYRKALQMQVGQPDALHFFGVLCHQRGRSDEGIELIRAALQVTPQHADAHNNLGNIHKECGRLAEAEACYRRALACVPQHADALGNLAIVLEAQQRPEEAFHVYQQLLAHAPKLGRAHYLMGKYLRDHVNTFEDVEQAVFCFRNAIRYDGRNVRALKALGIALYMLGRREEAIEVYRDWLEREPSNPVARHMLASCGGEAAPARADDAYVRQVFDSFADSFDEQLLNNLDYRAPQILVDALSRVLESPHDSLDVLDAGCGTGLCGPLIRPYARHLSGVDLSGGMVEKARIRGGYDELVVAELTAHLLAHPRAWDLVLSADTLVYFGELLTVLSATHDALRPGGRVAFTLEALDGEEDRTELSSSGRYRHTRCYVQRVLSDTGFSDVTITPESLRKEMGERVAGWVVLARKEMVENG